MFMCYIDTDCVICVWINIKNVYMSICLSVCFQRSPWESHLSLNYSYLLLLLCASASSESTLLGKYLVHTCECVTHVSINT